MSNIDIQTTTNETTTNVEQKQTIIHPGDSDHFRKKDNWDLFWNVYKELKMVPLSNKEERVRKLNLLKDFLAKAYFTNSNKYYDFFMKVQNSYIDLETGRFILNNEK